MNYKIFLVIPLLSIVSSGFSQTDSIAVINAKWQTQKISRGIKLKKHCFNTTLFNSNQNITILEVKAGRKNKIDLGYEQQKLKPTSEFGTTDNAIAALNGTFFDIKNGGSVDYIRSNGTVINKTRLGKNNERSDHQKSGIVFNNGKINIAQWDGTQTWEDKLGGEDVMVTGPMLITDGQRSSLDSSAFVMTRHPRSAVALKGKKVLLITVDGRNENAAGMSLFELASFLKWIKMGKALNLDGGGSTTLWVKGQPENGVVNYPSDNKKWDHAGERKVANVVLVKIN
ncbi:MAG TPA: phosphodiester glycosidase family protein [Sphingobacteriaceae bacterium]|nr:phosphodiester glycosidase family protein [Sphingobacteriaceae bacterium]